MGLREKRAAETVIQAMGNRPGDVLPKGDATARLSNHDDFVPPTPDDAPSECASEVLASLPNSKIWWNSVRAYQAVALVPWMKAHAKQRGLKFCATHVGINKVMASAMANQNERPMTVRDSMFLALPTITRRLL